YESGPWRGFSPGNLLTENLMEWSFAQGIEAFDFGVGDEDYKLEYCDVVIPLHIKTIRVTIKGLAYSIAIDLKEKFKTKLRDTRAGAALRTILRGRGDSKPAGPHAPGAPKNE